MREHTQDGRVYLLWGFGEGVPTPDAQDLSSLEETGDFVFTEDGVIILIR